MPVHLRRSVAASVLLIAVSACASGGDDGGGGVIEEEVVRPGITAIDEGAPTAACAQDVAALTAALDSYALLERSPATDEAALIAAGYLREQSALLDVVDGAIVAADADCDSVVPKVTPSGSAPLTAPATDVGEIVTSVEPAAEPMSTDEVLATMTDTDIAAYGGIDCATEIAAISAAGQVFIARESRNPDSLDELAGDLDREITLWTFDAASAALTPTADSPCPDVFRESLDSQQASACATERNTLETAADAYVALEGTPPADEQALLDAGLIAALVDAYDLDGTGAVVPAPDSPCA